MIRIWQFLIHGCWHVWKPASRSFIDHYDVSFGPRSFMYREYPARCTKCGRIGGIRDRTGAMPPEDML